MCSEEIQKTVARKVIKCVLVTECFREVLREDIYEVTFDQRPNKVGICSVYVHFIHRMGESNP